MIKMKNKDSERLVLDLLKISPSFVTEKYSDTFEIIYFTINEHTVAVIDGMACAVFKEVDFSDGKIFTPEEYLHIDNNKDTVVINYKKTLDNTIHKIILNKTVKQ